MKIHLLNIWTISGIMLLLLYSCQTEEFVQPAVGDKIPYDGEDATVRLKEALEASPYTLVLRAWNRSHLDSVLTARGGRYTLLAPDDAILIHAGWNEAKIDAATDEELDAFLFPYVLDTDLSPESLAGKNGYVQASSLYTYVSYRNKEDESAYTLRHALAYTNGQLYINGRDYGGTEIIRASNGYIWSIDHLISVPTLTAWDYLKNDGRFTIFLQLLQSNDSLYNELFRDAFNTLGMYAKDANSILVPTYHRDSPVQLGFAADTSAGDGYGYIDKMNTWFVPTDAAFQKAGFHTLADLMAFDRKRGYPDAVHIDVTIEQSYVYDYGTYQYPFDALDGYLATDSLLDHHISWGMRMKGFRWYNYRNTTLLFSQDLAAQLYNYPVASFDEPQPINTNQYGSTIGYTITNRVNSRIRATEDGYLQVDGSQQIRIADPDIYTLTGVIHAVDDLFYPNGTNN